MYAEMRRAAWAEISLKSIRENYRALRAAAKGSKIIAAVKADGYGHGAVKTAWELIKEGVDYLGVATLEEAVQLRRAGMRTPIVMLGTTPRMNAKDVVDLGIIPVVTTVEDGRILSSVSGHVRDGHPLEILVAVDTGMGRLGFPDHEDGLAAIRSLTALPGLKIHGLLSHFAVSEEEDPAYSLQQIERFSAVSRGLARMGVDCGALTMANSGAVAHYPQAHYDIIRPGLSLYGLYPSEIIDRGTLNLTPAMSIKANIVYLKKVPPGSAISYGRKFVTKRESLIATLPLGYADGLPRALNGQGRVIVQDCFAPVVGNVCMDQCMVDVTDVPGVQEYDEVILMGSQGRLTISAEEIGEKSGTVNYEVVCRFGQRLPKIYKD